MWWGGGRGGVMVTAASFGLAIGRKWRGGLGMSRMPITAAIIISANVCCKISLFTYLFVSMFHDGGLWNIQRWMQLATEWQIRALVSREHCERAVWKFNFISNSDTFYAKPPFLKAHAYCVLAVYFEAFPTWPDADVILTKNICIIIIGSAVAEVEWRCVPAIKGHGGQNAGKKCNSFSASR